MTATQNLTPDAVLNADTPLLFTADGADDVRHALFAPHHASEAALYEWTPESGMWRLMPRPAAVSGTHSALSALGSLAGTVQDSIFILDGMEPLLNSQGLQMALLGALSLKGPARRRVILPRCHGVPAELRRISQDLGSLLDGADADPQPAQVVSIR